MKKILLPTDFSNNSWNAIQYALKLFKTTKCNFYLINTYTPKIYGVEFLELQSAKFGRIATMKKVSQNGLDHLLEKIEKNYKNPKHTFTKISSFNTLVHELEELCLDHTIDYIVMGTQGAKGLKEILLGSNTVRVLKNVKCPILVIPNNFPFEPLHEVLFPSDYNINFEQKHIAPLLEMVAPFIVRINILNVNNGDNFSVEQEKNKNQLAVILKEHTPIFHRVTKQNIPEAIENFQFKHTVNLLVMINNKHSIFENIFFKSTINHIGFHLTIPFLVIPSKI